MKKLLVCTAALAMLTGTSLVFNNKTAQAAVNNDGNGKSITTNTYFEVDNTNSTNSPVDPLSPEKKLDPIDNHNVNPTNSTGNLTIDAVPEILKFGAIDQRAESDNVTENLKSSTESSEGAQYYYAQVSDFRNQSTGWHLTAQMSDMTDTTGSSNILKGERITFTKNSIEGAYQNVGNKENAPSTSDNILLTPNQTITMMSADSNKGKGTWLNLFNDINLTTPKANSGKYQGTITWNLSDGPSTPGSNNTSNSNQ